MYQECILAAKYNDKTASDTEKEKALHRWLDIGFKYQPLMGEKEFAAVGQLASHDWTHKQVMNTR